VEPEDDLRKTRLAEKYVGRCYREGEPEYNCASGAAPCRFQSSSRFGEASTKTHLSEEIRKTAEACVGEEVYIDEAQNSAQPNEEAVIGSNLSL
jgi:hypothetical protein